MKQKTKSSFFKRRKWALIGLAVTAAGVSFGLTSGTPTGTELQEAKVIRGNVSLSTIATGSVLPQNRLEIKPPVPGRVDTVLVREGQQVKKGEILAWMSSSERAALIDAARGKSKKEVKRWETLYRATPVIAPITGTIIARNVESGQTFSSAEAIFVMSDRLTIKAQVDETDISKIKLKQTAWITLDAYASEKISGKVDEIAYEAKPVNNVTTYAVDVLPLQTPKFMRAGMTANVRFILSSRRNVLLVPNEMIQSRSGISTVLVSHPELNYAPKEIIIGISDGKFTEVKNGLDEGDRIYAPKVNLATTTNPTALN